MSSAKRQWTPEQAAAIKTIGHSLLVSAAAGSGKTAVLTERCAYLVCDAPEPCAVDELLVVTFTEAAATEMRTRMRRALHERIAGDDSPRLVRQLASIERATVGTLHSFCGRLLRQHFHAAGLDPNFAVLDADAAILLKKEVIRTVIAEAYATDEDGTFASLLDGYFDGHDAAAGDEILSLYEKLTSLVNPRAWIRQTRDKLRQATDAPTLTESAIGRTFLRDVEDGIAALQANVDAALAALQQIGSFPPYVAALRDARQIVAHWMHMLQTSGIDALAEETDIPFPKLPPVQSTVPGKAVAKQLVDDVRAELKAGTLKDSLRFSEAQWQHGMAETLRPAGKLLEFVEQFSTAYQQAKNRRQCLDFSDLERRALSLLHTKGNLLAPSKVARGCHARYKHVLVDEFQDINELQEVILRLVSTECLGESRSNLFCVGDVKQSIYRFRSAEPELFLNRLARFKSGDSGGQLIDLNRNFRSRSALIDAVNAVFDRLMTKDSSGINYAADHRLVSGAQFPPATFTGSPIELNILCRDNSGAENDTDEELSADPDRAEIEATHIARRIDELMGKSVSPRAQVATEDGQSARDIRYGDIAILLRTRKHKISQYAVVLRKAGIPVLAESGSGFFDAMEVLDMLSLLCVLDNFRQDVPLAAVLRSPFGMMPEPEDNLARIRLAYPAEEIPFHEAVLRYEREYDDELAAHLRDIFGKLKVWRSLAQQRPLADVIEAIYQESGYVEFVCGLDDGEQRRANLMELQQRAAQFGKSVSASTTGGLSPFLRYLDELAEAADAGQATLASRAIDAVRIVSIHGAKGLEYPVVFVADLGKKFNLSDAAGSILFDKDEGLALSVVDMQRMVRYPSLASAVVAPRLRRKMLAEEMRVLYVAMTRAKEKLILVGSVNRSPLEKWQARWSSHAGPMPSAEVLASATALDWLGPIAIAGGDKFLTITVADMPASVEPERSEDDVAALMGFAALKPLRPDPAVTPAAHDVIERLAFRYGYSHFAEAAAAQSVTARAHTADGPIRSQRHGSDDPTALPALETLAKPRFTRPQADPGATDIGTATHLVLEHFDFSADASPIAAQVDLMCERQLLTRELRSVVDMESIEWFMATEVGQTLRKHARDVRREVPITFAAPVDGAATNDPRDRVMVRGRVDLFLPRSADGLLIDYKTDRVTGALLDERIAAYRSQMREYAIAMRAITGKPVAGWLVFLSQRKLVAIE